jgi:hypothetical protein
LKGYIRPHPQFRWEVVQVGRDKTPVIVIDNFLSNAPQIVEETAARYPFTPPRTIYPGLRSPAHSAYSVALYRILNDPIRRVYGFEGEDVVHVDCDFRMVTSAPEDLQIRQRLPHYDLASPKIIAVLHYLTAGPFGGTSFYRHRATGIERVEADQASALEATIAEELKFYTPEGYIVGDNPLFERIASVPMRFNRALVYPGMLLHSSDAPPGQPYSEDPLNGRLTGSAFFHYGAVNRPLPALT